MIAETTIPIKTSPFVARRQAVDVHMSSYHVRAAMWFAILLVVVKPSTTSVPSPAPLAAPIDDRLATKTDVAELFGKIAALEAMMRSAGALPLAEKADDAKAPLLATSLKGDTDKVEAIPAPSRHCIVVACDHKYMPCAMKLFRDLRQTFEYPVEIILLVPMSTVFNEKWNISLANVAVSVHHMDQWTRHRYKGSSDAYQRLHIFTSPTFRQYETVMYIDADSHVQHDITPLFNAIPPNATIVMRDNGVGINKRTLFDNEFSGRHPVGVANTLSPGCSCLFVVDMRRLPTPAVMDKELRQTLHDYHDTFKFADQSLLNVFFRDDYAVVWPCVHDVRVVPSDAQVRKGWAYAICGGESAELIVVHDYRKRCMDR